MSDSLYACCSWCFKFTCHDLIQKNIFRRNVYQCQNCLNRTLQCRWCKAMARGHDDWDDEKCSLCDGTIEKWESKPNILIYGWCSWCFEHNKHILIQGNTIRRDVYECESCGRRTLKCSNYDKCAGFARGHVTWDDENCIKCKEVIQSWNNTELNKSITKRSGWCSWCFENTTHTLEKQNKARRNVYTCDSCQQISLPCVSCDTGMTRGGPGWDDNYCSKCDNEIQDWHIAQENRNNIFTMDWNKERISETLSRESQAKQNALEAGMIRPFLFLVSMDPITRNAVASSLGWTLCTQKYFGDFHEEAWDIINSDVKGIQSRTNEYWETLNPLSSNCNWYESLCKVNLEIFKKKDIENLSYSKTIDGCRSRFSRLCADAEESFIKNISLLKQMQMTEQQLVEINELMESEEVKELSKNMKECGINSKEVIRYGINLVYQTIRMGGFNSYIVTVKIAAFMNRKLGTKFIMANATKNVARMVKIANVIGWLWLATDVLNLMFGSSHGRLFPAINIICNQKLLLAGDGIKIEDYYK